MKHKSKKLNKYSKAKKNKKTNKLDKINELSVFFKSDKTSEQSQKSTTVQSNKKAKPDKLSKKAIQAKSDRAMKIISIGSPTLAVLFICFFMFKQFGNAPATAHGTITQYTESAVITTERVAESAVTTPEFTPETASISDGSIPAGMQETEEISLAYNEYTEDFFDNILFIGDSISGGFSGFEYLKPENVFSKIGLNPSSALTDKILDVNDKNKSEKTVAQKAVEFQADYLCIMLGTNGMSYLEPEYMIDKMQLLIDELKTEAPNSKLVLMTIPPVSYEYEIAEPDNIKLDHILKYNELLKDFAVQNDCLLVDVYSLLCDKSGYYNDKLVDADGVHCHANAYPIILHEVEMTIRESQK